MRPLFHPSIGDISVAGVLHALSDPLRAEIFAQIACAKAAQSCSSFLHLHERDIPKSTLSQHFKALREAGLILSERVGVEIKNTSRCAEIEARFPGLIPAILKAHRSEHVTKADVRPERPGA